MMVWIRQARLLLKKTYCDQTDGETRSQSTTQRTTGQNLWQTNSTSTLKSSPLLRTAPLEAPALGHAFAPAQVASTKPWGTLDDAAQSTISLTGSVLREDPLSVQAKSSTYWHLV
jgi:hypothetical protein